MAGRRKRAVLIAGPTASGKSALGLALAREIGGVVVNTDAMQVYGGLRVVTARPSVAETEAAPHQLYGIVAPGERFSTGGWLAAAGELVRATEAPLVFVGGTGLYFDALLNGFAEVPPVRAEILAGVERELAGLDAQARGRLLARRDPVMAARLQAPDPQRVTRALAVQAATGRSLASFQDDARQGLLEDFDVQRIVLDPGREVLRERIAARFAGMFEGGAVEEVAALLALQLDPGLPVMKAIGVREIGGWLRGELTREAAIELGVIATHQYAKRQRTWFRSRMADWVRIDPSGIASVLEMVARLPQSG
jgi:tRNA dimethylallyltransferase